MIGNFGYGEIIIICFVVLMLFGAKRLPEIASSFGKSIQAFKKSVKEIQEEIPTQDEMMRDDPAPYKPPQQDKPKTEPGASYTREPSSEGEND